jgi:dipeptidyl-peptidase-4
MKLKLTTSFKLIGLTLFLFSFPLFAQQELSVEKIWKNFEFSKKGVSGFNGMKDGQHFTKLNRTKDTTSISIHSYKNYKGNGKLLLSSNELTYKGHLLEIDNYEFSADESKLLITTHTEPIYRRSFTADYFIYDFTKKALTPLDETKNGSTLAQFSPDGKKVAFVYENNLYVKDLETNTLTSITADGSKNNIINGTTDWVYEEEFSITKGFEWSFDSKKIAYLRFDESKVKEFNIDLFKGKLYPDKMTFKYPKAGEDNSKVTMHIYELEGKSTKSITLTNYEYIPRFSWSTTQNTLVIQTLNRHQSELNFYKVDATNSNYPVTIFFTEKSETYIDIDDNNMFILPNGKELVRTSEISGYKHIYKLGFDGKQTAITTGNWDVIELYGLNDKATTVYYASAEKGAIHKGVYKIGINGKNKMALSNETGYNSAQFTPGMNYFVLDKSDANTPNSYELKVESGKVLAVLEDNKGLKEKLTGYALTKKEFIEFTGPAGKLMGWMMKPINFDPTKQYPVYINIYGGPGHNTVLNQWGGNDYMYHQLLTQKGYIVVSVDPRGTQYRGAAHKKATYLNMGKLELEDFIATANELGKLPYVDKNRIGIQGWSYGGFMTSLAMTKGAPTFKMGIAVAPVTNWKYYDNIYTERFMRTPKENVGGYEDNSPIKYAKNLKGKYLLIHGTADDNVHYQNALEMMNAFIQANIQFDQFTYPNRNHGIYGGNTRNHLYTMLLDYTLKNL